jgi:hypothetical protein
MGCHVTAGLETNVRSRTVSCYGDAGRCDLILIKSSYDLVCTRSRNDHPN